MGDAVAVDPRHEGAPAAHALAVQFQAQQLPGVVDIGVENAHALALLQHLVHRDHSGPGGGRKAINSPSMSCAPRNPNQQARFRT
jgi:hypothetical protein